VICLIIGCNSLMTVYVNRNMLEQINIIVFFFNLCRVGYIPYFTSRYTTGYLQIKTNVPYCLGGRN